jgi:hypothetical protein
VHARQPWLLRPGSGRGAFFRRWDLSCERRLLTPGPSLFGRGEVRRGKKSLHPASPEIALVCCILYDVGGVALLGDVLRLGVFIRRILRDKGRVLWAFRAAIGRRNGWHMRAHGSSPDAISRVRQHLNCPRLEIVALQKISALRVTRKQDIVTKCLLGIA